ncbi:hypothetical protein KC19_10G158400 [Ceratodon purpureus]|uniref:Uncharacterized protein n=1 Tax=Ceratodon purpureus TaxID=3225 RepID=A0A8T0GKV2_CERPU|nr:hypothetical protein KC19_10G158400 [Ceratodon purpureus]
MESRGNEFGYGSRSFHAAARKLLAADSQAPTPVPAAVVCRDLKTGEPVHCQNPQTLLIIVGGMSCMMVMVAIATILLCLSVLRQRRLERRRQEFIQEHQLTALAPPSTNTSHTPTIPANSPEYDDAVFVQLPGDEKPQFFALPKPFLTDTTKDTPKPADVTDDGQNGEKDQSSEEAGENHDLNASDDADPCVQSSDGLFRNPLFGSQ